MALPLHIVDPLVQEPLDRGMLLRIISEIGDVDGQNADGIDGIVLDPPTNGDRRNDLRWLNGITWIPEPNFAVYGNLATTCTRIDFTGVPRVCDPALTQKPFNVYDAFQGSVLEFTPNDIEEILKGRLTRKLSAVFAKELIDGLFSGDRSLANTAHAPFLRAFGTAALPIWHALNVLEDDLARTLRGSEGIIHMPPGLLGQAVASYGLRLDEDNCWETPLGNKVIADAGYVDTLAPDNRAPSPADTEWVYASGPVAYAKLMPEMVDGGNFGSALTNYTGTENLSAAGSGFMSRDRLIRFASAYGIFQFDSAPVTAVLASTIQTAIV